MGSLIDGRKIQNELKTFYKKKIALIKDKLKLVVIQVGDDPAGIVYVRNKEKMCNEVGILFECIKYDFVTEDDLILKIKELNDDDTVTGILLQLPLPIEMDESKVIDAISPLKDVDGLTCSNIGNLFSGKPDLVSCTALGIMEILKSINVCLEGTKVAIVGKSKLVGIPLMALLLKENATISVCNSKTKGLKDITSSSDIVIVGVGKKCFITSDYIKDDAIVIDVGINRENGKLYGDCAFDELVQKCKYITPVPGGVGPLTVVMLVGNIVKAYELQKKFY
ncbi:MAG: bifunctional 5,10-methylenetetrahydrofolate dehydrogenase/5,10-methenyltetrahydrofolate cyclohydrolase [Bacilli bacterium]